MALGGLCVPVPTLFDDQGDLDPDRNRRFAEGLLRSGVEHLFPLGSLGEFPSVEEDERHRLLTALSDALRGAGDLWVGVGAPATRRALQRVRAATDVGAAALIAVPPYYLAPTEAAIAEYYRQLRTQAAAPLLAYNIPSKVGYALSPALVHRLGADGVLAGIKDTAGSIASVRGFLAGAPPGFVVLPGDDALASGAIAGGASGAIMGTANVVPGLGLALVQAARTPASTETPTLQGLVDRISRAIGRGPFPASVKFLARRLRGAPDGYRAPYDALTDSEEHDVLSDIDDLLPQLDRYLRESPR